MKKYDYDYNSFFYEIIILYVIFLMSFLIGISYLNSYTVNLGCTFENSSCS
jgi:hypothetical protein